MGDHKKGPMVLYVLKVPVGTNEPFLLKGIQISIYREINRPS
jgi:hypothetical protein